MKVFYILFVPLVLLFGVYNVYSQDSGLGGSAEAGSLYDVQNSIITETDDENTTNEVESRIPSIPAQTLTSKPVVNADNLSDTIHETPLELPGIVQPQVSPSVTAPIDEEQAVVLDTIQIIGKKDTTEYITQTDMERMNASNLWDALGNTPGISLDAAGQRNDYSVKLRGFDSRQVPMFIDDIPVYTPYDGYMDFSRVLSNDLESIEVFKGYSSSLLGANTMGGAINLRTAKPKKKLEIEVKAGNNFDSDFGYMGGNYYVSAGTRQELFYTKLSYNYAFQDYFLLSHSFTPGDYQKRGRRENSAYKDAKLATVFGFTPISIMDWSFSYVMQRGNKEQPPVATKDPATNQIRFWKWPVWDKDSLYTNLSFELPQNGYLKVLAYYDTYKNTLESYVDESFTTKLDPDSDYDDYTSGGKVEGGLDTSSSSRIQGAISYKKDTHRSITGGVLDAKNVDEIWSYGVEYTKKLDQQYTLVLGGSYDKQVPLSVIDYKDSDPVRKGRSADALNGQAGIFYDIDEDNELHFTVALKSHMPTMKDRYSYRMGRAIPNPDLKVEKAYHYEVGYKGMLYNMFNVTTSVFFSNINDMIMSRDNVSGTKSQNKNYSKVLFYGFDLGAKAYINEYVSGGATFSYLHGKNEDDVNKGDKLTYRPECTASAFVVVYPLPYMPLSITPRVEYTGEQYSSTDGDKVGDFFLVHTAAGYAVTENVNVEVGVKNIFDVNYEYSYGYNLAGRTYFANVAAKF